MELFLKADTWLALLTLCFLEIVLGIDNIIFISIVSNKLPEEHRTKARNVGLFLAMFVRIALLLTITWIIQFTQPLFTIPANFLFGEPKSFSGKDLILGFGGLFLIAKSTMEIGHGMESEDELEHGQKKKKVEVTLAGTIVQIILLDIIFSFDSILTAVGIVDPDKVIIMISAVVISIFIMMFFSGRISRFIQDHPSMEVLALGFLILIGFMLFLEALHVNVPKAYIYFAVAFAVLIEFTNIRVKKSRKNNPIKLHKKAYNKQDIETPSPTISSKLTASQELERYPIGRFAAQESYSTDDIAASIAKIESLPSKLEHVAKSLSEEQLNTPYRDGGWTVRQVLHHIADSHMNAYIRIKLALTEEEPTIKAYNEKAWANTAETHANPSISVDLLKDLHIKWVLLLKGLKPSDLEKAFIHPDGKKHTRIDKAIAMYAWHGEHHLAQITSLKEKMGWNY